ncbi:MAG: class IV adenylate cyclase [Pseudomarimonas sp.]
MKEIEIKIPLLQSHPCLQQLDENYELLKSVNERDMYFDRYPPELARDDRVLRLRIQNEKVLIAFKGPRSFNDGVVSRDEFETEIGDYQTAMNVVTGLGYQPIHVVEKRRRYYLLNKEPRVLAVVDKMPFIGLFIELEGEEEKLLQLLRTLHLRRQDATESNYSELFQKHLIKTGLYLPDPNTKFTFEAEECYSMTSD